MTAYQKVVTAGFKGTVQDWYAKLVGDPGFEVGNERNGASAYELFVANGFTGTEDEWRASLKGDKGDIGNTLFATFNVDMTTGHVMCTTSDGYNGPTFNINNNGHMEVTI